MNIETYANECLILDEQPQFSLAELSQACTVDAEWVIALVHEGILEPTGDQVHHWRFSGLELQRAQMVMRFQHDLDINLAGAALALDLLTEIDQLRAQLEKYR